MQNKKIEEYPDDINVYLYRDKFDENFLNRRTEIDDEPINFVNISYSLKGVDFPNLIDWLSLQKCDEEYTLEEFKNDLSLYITFENRTIVNPMAPPEHVIENMWKEVLPMTAKEVFEKYADNAEQRMVALSFIPPDQIHKEVNASLVSEETINKTQRKTYMKDSSKDEHNLKPEDIVNSNYDDMFEEKIITRKETYRLYRIDQKEIDGLDNDLMYVHVICPSTNKDYFIYVDPDDERCNNNALDAIAWTFSDPETGENLNRDQYVQLQQET